MTEKTETPDPFTNMYEAPAKAFQQMQRMWAPFLPANPLMQMPPATLPDMSQWQEIAERLQEQWKAMGLALPQPGDGATQMATMADPAQYMAMMQEWFARSPFASPDRQKAMWEESMDMWQRVMNLYGFAPGMALGATTGKADGVAVPDKDAMPLKDKRFADDRWRAHPAFALIHQTYLMMAQRMSEMVDELDDLPEEKREQMRFFTKAMTDAMSPANFPMTNPVVLERTLETGGQNLVKGMEHLMADLARGQLSHTDAKAFELGKNIAVTPGKVVHETRMYQLIQYTPTTDKVLETPLVIFPPWINRFYILDLNEKKSFVRWAVEQGVTVFMVSWKSADASLADVEWSDYIDAQIEAIDVVRERLDVPAVHTIGYCVAGTTLAATLSLLEQRGDADKVKSATFFTAQVDFEDAGDLLHFVDDHQIAALQAASTDGYTDGRLLAATFNMLRGTDLIWNYVVNNYLLGEDYPAFDLLHWNGDVTNLPSKWHRSYLEDLYRDNKLAKPGELSIDGTPIDLTLVKTPTYIQAGREDHIAPAASVWKMTDHFSGPVRFVLAGSGHIAGVVNPPDANKYQYWTNEDAVDTLDEFVEGATEHPGSWWPNWLQWLKSHDGTTVSAKGKRKPGGKNDNVIEDAPGRYVMAR
ncbi:class I poly(R)-hydroxyalkanoic acid synthase [Parapontixanthobacter aurantiacus]|nr:class I poly(R)-hydroxyalkanoic acid synthase [Parapontixanthobacter aurantiacus]